MARIPVTIVTGGSRGIGAAVTRRLAQAGHALVVNYRTDEQSADELVAALTLGGTRVIALQADVTVPEEVEGLFSAAAAFGTVTGLVSSAGATLHVGSLSDTPVSTIRDVLDVNLWSALLCAREAARSMSTSRGGVGGAIVTISSAAATLGSPHEYVHYAAAKAGVDAMTVGLAKELASEGIRVNAVSPGPIETRIHADAGDPDRTTRLAGRIPMGRAGLPEEVAPAVAWLLSDEAAYVTGANIRVAGGL